MGEIHEFPKTADQRAAERQLIDAMHAFNEAIKRAAKCGFEIEIMQKSWSFTTYSRDPVPYVDVTALVFLDDRRLPEQKRA